MNLELLTQSHVFGLAKNSLNIPRRPSLERSTEGRDDLNLQ